MLQKHGSNVDNVKVIAGSIDSFDGKIHDTFLDFVKKEYFSWKMFLRVFAST